MIYYCKGQNIKLQPNFTAREFDCQGKNCGCTGTWIDPQLAAWLQQIRNHFDKAVHITSAFRCSNHNKAVGGSANSYHTHGEAADFYISGVDTTTIAAYCEQLGILGIGCYDKNHGSFVHIDTRQQKYFWKNQSSNTVSTFGSQIATDPTVPKANLYAVTCRIADDNPMTLLFDHSIGTYRQNGITMTPGEENTNFTAEQNAQILRISLL